MASWLDFFTFTEQARASFVQSFRVWEFFHGANLASSVLAILLHFFQPTVRSSLEGQKYEILSAGVFYIPNHYCQIESEREAAAAEAFIKAIENSPGVTAVHHNLA